MGFNQPENVLRCTIEGASNTNYSAEDFSATVNLNEWHHGACVFDSATKKLRAYLDGNLVAEKDTAGEGLVDGTGRFFIGAIDWQNTTTNPMEEFDGEIDDARLYNRALTDEEIQALYNLTGVCSNPSRAGGTIIFNTTANVMQYCDGKEWRKIGP